MGDRGHVKIESTFDNPPVYLYTHWGANELPQTVARAIARRERWDDPEYLARIVFEQMIHDLSTFGKETGLGIGTQAHGDVWRIVTLDIEEQKALVHDRGELVESWEFDRLADDYTPTEFREVERV